MTHLSKVVYPREVDDIHFQWRTPPFTTNISHGAYGETRVQELAGRSPTAVVVNADNYALYALAISRDAVYGLSPASGFANQDPGSEPAPWEEIAQYWDDTGVHHGLDVVWMTFRHRQGACSCVVL